MLTSVSSKSQDNKVLLEARNIRLSIDSQPILRDISLAIKEGEIVALLGPSGCGKTTLLRVIAGLTTTDAGTLLLKGENIGEVPVHKRHFGMVFQDYALFPHKSVSENVAFGLKMGRWDQDLQARRVDHILKLVGLQGFEDRRVYELSGGEQQRVALARSLAPSPQLILLDEPLGALDRALREQLMGELRLILKRAGKMDEYANESPSLSDRDIVNKGSSSILTSIYVTHDQEEAFAVADRVMVMNTGKIEQVGTPVELYRRPRSQFVAKFLGMDNLIAIETILADPPRVRTAIGELLVDNISEYQEAGNILLIRPEAGIIVTGENKYGINFIKGKVESISFRGRHQVVSLAIPKAGKTTRLRLNFGSSIKIDPAIEEITIRLDPAELQIISR